MAINQGYQGNRGGREGSRAPRDQGPLYQPPLGDWWEKAMTNPEQGLEELIGKVAEARAKTAAVGTNYNQVRNFYDTLIAYQGMLKAQPTGPNHDEPWVRVNCLVKLLLAKLAYARARNNGKLVSSEFCEAVGGPIVKMKTKKNFDDYMLFMEAFVGYFRVYAKSK